MNFLLDFIKDVGHFLICPSGKIHTQILPDGDVVLSFRDGSVKILDAINDEPTLNFSVKDNLLILITNKYTPFKLGYIDNKIHTEEDIIKWLTALPQHDRKQ
jgi:hypothetical protein